jgi:hypothetical protein
VICFVHENCGGVVIDGCRDGDAEARFNAGRSSTASSEVINEDFLRKAGLCGILNFCASSFFGASAFSAWAFMFWSMVFMSSAASASRSRSFAPQLQRAVSVTVGVPKLE